MATRGDKKEEKAIEDHSGLATAWSRYYKLRADHRDDQDHSLDVACKLLDLAGARYCRVADCGGWAGDGVAHHFVTLAVQALDKAQGVSDGGNGS